MRVVDVMLSLPLLFVILVASRFFGNGNVGHASSLIFGLFSWMGVSRLVRSLFLSIREREFVEAARAVGVRDRRIIFRHILPNAFSPIVVVGVAARRRQHHRARRSSASSASASTRPTPTWGNILSNALHVHPARATGGGRSSRAWRSS